MSHCPKWGKNILKLTLYRYFTQQIWIGENKAVGKEIKDDENN
jgi:hypothetical protein